MGTGRHGSFHRHRSAFLHSAQHFLYCCYSVHTVYTLTVFSPTTVRATEFSFCDAKKAKFIAKGVGATHKANQNIRPFPCVGAFHHGIKSHIPCASCWWLRRTSFNVHNVLDEIGNEAKGTRERERETAVTGGNQREKSKRARERERDKKTSRSALSVLSFGCVGVFASADRLIDRLTD